MDELMVVKRDGRREQFSRDKLLAGVTKACQKRPIGTKVVEDMVERVVASIYKNYDREVPGAHIGEKIMNELREVDDVAYVRFASVYRRFKEAKEFVREVRKLEVKR
jgi:transcriptional repressor NrdR